METTFKPLRLGRGQWAIVDDNGVLDGNDDTIYPTKHAAQAVCDSLNFTERGFDEFRASELRYD